MKLATYSALAVRLLIAKQHFLTKEEIAFEERNLNSSCFCNVYLLVLNQYCFMLFQNIFPVDETSGQTASIGHNAFTVCSLRVGFVFIIHGNRNTVGEEECFLQTTDKVQAVCYFDCRKDETQNGMRIGQ